MQILPQEKTQGEETLFPNLGLKRELELLRVISLNTLLDSIKTQIPVFFFTRETSKKNLKNNFCSKLFFLSEFYVN